MKLLKSISYALSMFLFVGSILAQNDKSQRPSPPAQISKEVNGTKVTIDYSRPSKKGRKIFGELESFGKIWRTGANETSWIEVSNDVEIEGQTLPAGKYGLFTIPNQEEWVIIFNKAWNGWGAYSYDASNDVLRVNVPVKMLEDPIEVFSIDISDSGDVSLSWDDTQVSFTLK